MHSEEDKERGKIVIRKGLFREREVMSRNSLVSIEVFASEKPEVISKRTRRQPEWYEKKRRG